MTKTGLALLVLVAGLWIDCASAQERGPAESVTITVTTSDPARGFVVRQPTNLDTAPASGASYEIVVPKKFRVTLEAWPYEGSAFLRWSGVEVHKDFVENQRLDFIANEDATVCAHFSKSVVVMVLEDDAQNPVSTAQHPPMRFYTPGGRAEEIDDERDGYALWQTFAEGSEVTVIAYGSPGWMLKHWYDRQGNVLSDDDDYTFTISADTELRAEYVASHEVELTVLGGGAIKVPGWENTVLDEATIPTPQGKPLVLEAIPNEGYRFLRWIVDGEESTNPRLEINATQNMFVDVIFESEWVGNGEYYVLTLIPDGIEGILWIDQGDEYIHIPTQKKFKTGTVVTVVIAPAEGHQFIQWRGDFSGVQNYKRFRMNGDWVIGADFEKIEPLPNDADKDNIADDWETAHGLNPAQSNALADGDTDGLLDFYEYRRDTDPKNADTDKDALPDGWEVENGLDPKSALGESGPNGDPDGDGRSNAIELKDKSRADLYDLKDSAFP